MDIRLQVSLFFYHTSVLISANCIEIENRYLASDRLKFLKCDKVLQCDVVHEMTRMFKVIHAKKPAVYPYTVQGHIVEKMMSNYWEDEQREKLD